MISCIFMMAPQEIQEELEDSLEIAKLQSWRHQEIQ